MKKKRRDVAEDYGEMSKLLNIIAVSIPG